MTYKKNTLILQRKYSKNIKKNTLQGFFGGDIYSKSSSIKTIFFVFSINKVLDAKK